MNEVKGILGIICTGIAGAVSLLEQIHAQMQIASLAATVVLAIITARYYWNKTKYYKSKHENENLNK